jgi:DNA-binding response OmpR family regulator
MKILKMLYVEDMFEWQEILRANLPEAVDLTVVATKEEAREALLNGEFDYVVLDNDLELPNQGLDLIAEARALHPKARVIFISERIEFEPTLIVKAKLLGAHNAMVKLNFMASMGQVFREIEARAKSVA